MKIKTSLNKDQISKKFYSKVRSEKEIDEFLYNTSLQQEDFFFGDIDKEGNFKIKHHRPQGRENRVEPTSYCIVGKVTCAESGFDVEYTCERTQINLEMLVAWGIVCVVMFLLTVFKDVLAGLILLAVMVLTVTVLLTYPKEKRVLLRLAKTIFAK